MRILINCKRSGKVRQAFRDLGHDAWSCDIEPADDGSPHHIQRDAIATAYQHVWDMMIAFPPCTDLCVSGARWFAEKRADGRQARAVHFFMAIIDAPIPKIGVENPIGIMSREYRKPDQIIQPWQFGHGETKATCLWLKGLPKLTPTTIVDGRAPRVHHMPPGPERARMRSETYSGIALAMAQQWGAL